MTPASESPTDRDEDAPLPRVETQSQALMVELADQLGLEKGTRAEVLRRTLDRISHLNSLFGSLSVALKIDQPSNPLEVVDQVRKLQRKLGDF